MYIRYPGIQLSSASYPLLAPDGTGAAPSYSFASDTDLGIYRVSSNILGISATNLNFFGAAASTVSIGRTISDGSLIIGGNPTGGLGGLIEFFGSTHASKAGTMEFNVGSSVQLTAGSISALGLWTIQAGTTKALALNNLLATNGAQTATMTNLPAAATSGNPFGWLQVTINGTTSYIPFWH